MAIVLLVALVLAAVVSLATKVNPYGITTFFLTLALWEIVHNVRFLVRGVRKSSTSRALAFLTFCLVMVAGLGLGLARSAAKPADGPAAIAGDVYFFKSADRLDGNTCQLDAPIRYALTSDPIYLMAAFNATMQEKDSYVLEISKNGNPFSRTSGTADKPFSCYVGKDPIGPLPAGTYEFTFSHDGNVEADGTIFVNAAGP